MAFTGGPQDLRHYRHRLRQLMQALMQDTTSPTDRSHGDAEQLARALNPWLTGRMSGDLAAERPAPRRSAATARSSPHGVDPAQVDGESSAPLQSPLWSYEDWRAAQCEAAGIDDDFYSEQEWLELHAEALARGEVRSPPITPTGTSGASGAELQATATAITRLLQQDEALGLAPGQRPGTRLQERQQAQHAVARLESRLARAPQSADATSRWLVPALCRSLRRAAIRTLDDLARHIRRHGAHWHRPVTGLGIVRARRLQQWLVDAGLEVEPTAAALRPAHAPAAGLAHAPTTVPVFDPKISPRLDPAHGAVQAWLAGHSGPAQRDYARSADRLMRWCLQVRRTPLARLRQADLDAWLDFIAAPDPGWIQPAQRPRGHAEWRPFRGPLSPASQRQERVALAGLLAHLHAAGLLIAPLDVHRDGHLPPPTARSDDRRSLDAHDWAFIHEVLQERPESPWRTRLALLLALAGPAGLRLSELAVARLQDLQAGPEAPQGGAWLRVGERGRSVRARRVPISAEVLALIRRHHRDMDAGGLGHEPAQPRVHGLPEPVVRATQALAGPHRDATDLDDWRPLIGILKRPPPRVGRPARVEGATVIDHHESAPGLGHEEEAAGPWQSDRHGALERSALYQALKRFLRDVARQAAMRPGAPDPVRFLRASTHWLRGLGGGAPDTAVRAAPGAHEGRIA